MEIKVEHRKRREKKEVVYNIEFISNYCFTQYNKLNARIIEVLQVQTQLQDCAERLGIIKSSKDGNISELKEEIETLSLKIKEGKDIIEWQWEILKELFESNDIDLDREYWERTTQKDEVSKFLGQIFGVNEAVKKKQGIQT